MSSTLTNGCSAVSSAGVSATVSMPIPRSMSTLCRSAEASPGPTTARNPVRVKTGGPPIRSGQSRNTGRSEEHTSELQSRVDLVCRLLLEKKKKRKEIYKSAAVAENEQRQS